MEAKGKRKFMGKGGKSGPGKKKFKQNSGKAGIWLDMFPKEHVMLQILKFSGFEKYSKWDLEEVKIT